MKKETMVIMACIDFGGHHLRLAPVTMYIVINKKKPKTVAPQPTAAVTEVQPETAPAAEGYRTPDRSKIIPITDKEKTAVTGKP